MKSSFTACPLTYLITMFLSWAFVSSCSNVQTDKHPFAVKIENAHNMETWKTKGALKTNLNLQFGGQNRLNAVLYVSAGGHGIRLETGGDTVAVFDGQNMWVAPSDSAVSPFDLKTWAYFLKVPYKLNDPGTVLTPADSAQIRGQMYSTAKLTFKAGTGDTPDDWYILYRNPKNQRLHAMAYIVTYGSSAEEASKNPHAISYENFKMMDDIPIATTWYFWSWNAEQGFSDEPLGQARLTNIGFVSENDLFSKPEGALPMKR